MTAAIAAAFARRVLGKREPEFASAGERLVFEAAIGLGMLGLLIFALGALQLFYLPAFLGLLLSMAAAGWRQLSSVISDAARGLATIRRVRWQTEAAVTGVILAAVGVLALIRALAPPVGDDWDSLAYHLAIPKLYLRHHGIFYVNFAPHSNFPFMWEMLYALGLAFRSVSFAKLFHFLAGCLLVGAAYTTGKRHFSRGAGALAALILAGVPLAAWAATTAYIDLAAALYSLLVVCSLLNYSESSDRRWAVLAGICAGLAAGTKMTALVMLPVIAVWLLRRPRQAGDKARVSEDSALRIRHSAFRTAAVSLALAVLIAAPWYVKSWVYTGNPVYPFAYSVFGGRNWSTETAALYQADQMKFGMGRDLPSLVMLPWNLTVRFARFGDYAARLPRDIPELPAVSGNALVYLSSIGPVFLAALPVLLLGASRRGRHRPMLVVSLALTAIWFFTMQNTRYLLPAIAILAPAAAQSANLVKARRTVFGVAAAAGAFTIFLLAVFTWPAVPAVLGLQSRTDYLQRLDIYRASDFANESLPKDAKIAMFGETRGFYLDREYLWADPGHNALIPYDRMRGDPLRLSRWLKSRGFDYVLVNGAIFPDYHKADAPAYALLVGRATERAMAKVYPEVGYAGESISVYRIVK